MKHQLPLVAPSILAADYANLNDDIRQSLDGGAEWLHCDVMDGHFVPNICNGPLIIEAAGRSSDAFLDVHLMIENPETWIGDFVKAGADLITVHYEATPHIHRCIQMIRDQGVKAGVAINPGTPVDFLEPILGDADLALLMSVNPGFGGQKFIESSYRRISRIKEMREDTGTSFLIEIDGGVNSSNIEKISRSGADVIVAGNSVFKADNISEQVKELIHKARLGKTSLV